MYERYLGRIQSGMDVCDSRGGGLGSVVRVYRYESASEADERATGDVSTSIGDEVLEVKTGLFGLGKHLWVPIGSIQEVISDSVFLAIRGLNDEIDRFKQ